MPFKSGRTSGPTYYRSTTGLQLIEPTDAHLVLHSLWPDPHGCPGGERTLSLGAASGNDLDPGRELDESVGEAWSQFMRLHINL